MLGYEWGNPSTMMLNGDEQATQIPDPNRPIFNHYTPTFNETLLHPNAFTHQQQPQQHHFLPIQAHSQAHAHFGSFYDPCGAFPPPSLDHMGGSSSSSAFMVLPKAEPMVCGVDFSSPIGLNLGGRTYFSSAEDDFVNRLYRRSRPLEAPLLHAPKCQAEGCHADLTHAKHYHRRHKVCEFHSKASTVIANGLTQRFCQQCSRFHLLSEFDNGKRSCRRRLADHNRRRRKSSQQQNQDQNKSRHVTTNTSSENTTKSPPDSGVHSSSSVSIAISPASISLDCFGQQSYQTSTRTSSTSSLFFSSS